MSASDSIIQSFKLLIVSKRVFCSLENLRGLYDAIKDNYEDIAASSVRGRQVASQAIPETQSTS